jgi:chromosomal replication initiation ATPase DnaA
MEQLNFKFSNNVDLYDINNFVIHDGNRKIFDFITSSCFLNTNIYLLTGPEKSGKTYLCNMWYKFQNAVFIDKEILSQNESDFFTSIKKIIINDGKFILENIENNSIKEECLFYLINLISEMNSTLLITSKKYLFEFHYKLEDLDSRIKNIYNFVLEDLNYENKEKILLKILTDRQMSLNDNELKFVVSKLSNNYESIFNFVDLLEKSLQESDFKKNTISNLKKILK